MGEARNRLRRRLRRPPLGELGSGWAGGLVPLLPTGSTGVSSKWRAVPPHLSGSAAHAQSPHDGLRPKAPHAGAGADLKPKAAARVSASRGVWVDILSMIGLK